MVVLLVIICTCSGCKTDKNDGSKINNTIKELTSLNYNEYVSDISCKDAGHAAFYIYIIIEIRLNPEYVAYSNVQFRVRFSGHFKAVLEDDFVTPVSFSDSEIVNLYFVNGQNSHTKHFSLYKLKYNDYAFVEMISSNISIIGVSGQIVAKE